MQRNLISMLCIDAYTQTHVDKQAGFRSSHHWVHTCALRRPEGCSQYHRWIWHWTHSWKQMLGCVLHWLGCQDHHMLSLDRKQESVGKYVPIIQIINTRKQRGMSLVVTMPGLLFCYSNILIKSLQLIWGQGVSQFNIRPPSVSMIC